MNYGWRRRSCDIREYWGRSQKATPVLVIWKALELRQEAKDMQSRGRYAPAFKSPNYAEWLGSVSRGRGPDGKTSSSEKSLGQTAGVRTLIELNSWSMPYMTSFPVLQTCTFGESGRFRHAVCAPGEALSNIYWAAAVKRWAMEIIVGATTKSLRQSWRWLLQPSERSNSSQG